MANKQTAVEFLLAELDIAHLIAREKLTMAAEVVRQAKEMEEQQRRQDFFAGVKCTEEGRNGEFAMVNRPNVESVFLNDYEEYINPNE